jgi:hypothetical protein
LIFIWLTNNFNVIVRYEFHIDIITGYENSFPPNFPQVTEVINYVYVQNTLNIDEKNMLFSVTFSITSIWEDPRLAYTDSITTKTSIDMISIK